MILQLRYFNDPILRQQGEPIKHFDETLKTLASDMIETMSAEEGIGLAAQQIGKKCMLCVIDLPLNKKDAPFSWRYDGELQPMPFEQLMPMVLVNPQINHYSRETSDYIEGCLSFPEINGEVTRPASIHLHFQDLNGIRHALECNDLFARVIQHEVDHLNGKLFIDHMDKKTLRQLSLKMNRLKRQSDDKLKKAKKLHR